MRLLKIAIGLILYPSEVVCARTSGVGTTAILLCNRWHLMFRIPPYKVMVGNSPLWTVTP